MYFNKCSTKKVVPLGINPTDLLIKKTSILNSVDLDAVDNMIIQVWSRFVPHESHVKFNSFTLC